MNNKTYYISASGGTNLAICISGKIKYCYIYEPKQTVKYHKQNKI